MFYQAQQKPSACSPETANHYSPYTALYRPPGQTTMTTPTHPSPLMMLPPRAETRGTSGSKFSRWSQALDGVSIY